MNSLSITEFIKLPDGQGSPLEAIHASSNPGINSIPVHTMAALVKVKQFKVMKVSLHKLAYISIISQADWCHIHV